MTNKEHLQEENKRWHDEHLAWIQETEQWQHETRRLLALLYLLERALPEHSSMLNKHAILIADNEQKLNCYECDIVQQANLLPKEQQTEYHQRLAKLHEEVKQEHLTLQRTYSEEKGRFKSLVLKLLKEC
tara:strand:- start:207466 stop:207855 length:390 start_codon:yes stop_codon:yes gene_type:complete